MIGVRRVEVHRFLHQPQSQRGAVEISVALRLGGNRGDVM
jgi:hypothetical protein